MVQICHLCHKGEVVTDKKMSGQFCTGCGECFELGAFTDEIQYREDERGRYTAVGTTYNVDKGFVNSKFTNHAQLMTSVDNARAILKRYCDKLYISVSFAQMATSHYQRLLIKKFMNGRRLNVVLAACLYIAVRSEGANVILLDISDVSEANVYDIGRYYFQIVRILHFNIQTVDPCEYTIRFVDMLNLGDRTLAQVKRASINIRDTANRLVQRMKRDWIHFGRRPSGVCAAAVLVSARINNVRCTIKDIIAIAKVCESTIRKRINEFIQTPASKLTMKEFMSQELDQEEDPPSYKMSTSIDDAVEENLEKVEKYQEIIEEHLKDSRAKLKGMYAKFLKEILSSQNDEESQEKRLPVADEETKIIQEAIIDQNILAVNQNVVAKIANELKNQGNDSGNPSAEEIEYWAEHRPSAKSLGLLKREENTEIDIKAPYEDLLNENLDDMDDDELDAYIISDESEVGQRQIEWNILNREYLKLMEEKESLKRAQLDDDSKTPAASKIRKKRKRNDDSDQVEASTASEAVEAAFKGSESISRNGINLKELFNEDTASSLNNEKLQIASSDSNVIDDEDTIIDSGIAKVTNGNKNEDVVQMFHTYALKTGTDKDTVLEASISVNENSSSDVEIEVDNSNKPDLEKAVLSTPVSFSGDDDLQQDDVDTFPATSKSKLNDAEEDEDEDDYFVDEDDELAKIKKKYGAIAHEEGVEEDYEDCGF